VQKAVCFQDPAPEFKQWLLCSLATIL